MWNALPFKELKCSKKMDTKAAISLPVSSLVFYNKININIMICDPVDNGRTVSSPCSAYEKPTPTGWSMKKILALEFHDSG
jgi:hypothetical protein